MEKFSKIIVPAIIGLSAVGALYVCCTHTLSRRSRAAQIDMPSTPSLPEVRRARLIFAGDLMQHTPQLTAARTPEGDFDFNASFDWVRERFRAADAAIVNLETTLSESGPYTGYPCFRSPAALAEALDSLGVDITVLANNHCCDGGSKGIRTTIRELDRHGIEHTGVFLDSSDFRARHPLRFEAGGIRFALLNYTYGTNGLPVPSGLSVNPIDTVRIAADLAAVEHDGVDCVIACMHWGNEYERRPNKVQRQLAGFLRRHGVDLIVGSHPHVVQPYEQDSNGIVLYSLGNFVSNQRKRYCDGGIVATVEVTRSPDGSLRYSLELTPVWVLTPGYRITPSEVGDTLSMPADSRQRYERFMTDTRLLLGLYPFPFWIFRSRFGDNALLSLFIRISPVRPVRPKKALDCIKSPDPFSGSGLVQ